MTPRLVALCVAVSMSQAFGQVRVEVNVPLPTITFSTPPPLVVVQPGIQVVENADEEVFVHENAYWTRRDGHWFRSRSHNGGWVVVENGAVPRTLLALPPGQYRHYHREERREERREDRREKHHGKH